VGHVEAEGLEEQDEGHPLVVGMPLDLVLCGVIVSNSGGLTSRLIRGLVPIRYLIEVSEYDVVL